MDTTIQILTILILLLALVISVIVTQFIRRRRGLFALRNIPAYRMLPLAIGEAIETDRPVHVSFGSTGLGGTNTVLTLATAELFYQTAERASIGGVPPILTVSDPTALPLGQDTLRRAYQSRDLLGRYRSGSVRWYPSGSRSLAFAAALTATIGDDRVSANVLVGSFGAGLALVGDAAARRELPVIATSDELVGQSVAYVMSGQPLIGEEIFTAGAYLGESPTQVAGVVTQDILRLLLIIGILVPTALAVGDAILQGRFSAAVSRVLGGG